MDRKKCPFLGGKKCVGDACMFWGIETFVRDGAERAEPGCLIVFNYQMVRFAAAEQGRVQASVDKVCNEVNRGFGRLNQLALDASMRVAQKAIVDGQ